MKKRIVSTLLCIVLILGIFPVVSLAEYVAPAPLTSLSAPTIRPYSDNERTYVTVIHSEDAMRHIAAEEWSRWGDETGGEENNDYYWNGYGRGKKYDNYVQIDWRIPGGAWHYTTEWDTNLEASESILDDSTYFYGSDCGGTYYAFINGNCYTAQADSVFYPLKSYFKEYFDGYDYYYLFDQTKTVEFRCRYLIRETSGGYYDNSEEEETVRYISSPWSQTVAYGQGGNSQAQIPQTLPAPTLESPEVTIGTGYANANEIHLYAFAPKEMAYLEALELDVEEISIDDLEVYTLFEASLDGETWYTFSGKNLRDNRYTLDTSDIWYEFLREEGQSWGDYLWYTANVQIRARYEMDYVAWDYSGDEPSRIYVDNVYSAYSNTLTVTVPGVNRYDIHLNYKTEGASNSSKQSFVRNENTSIGWINLAPAEGFYVTKVLVNGAVMYEKEDTSTHQLLEWYNEKEFRFWNDPLATENLEIDVYFGGQAPTKHTLSYTQNAGSTGSGEIEVTYPGGDYTLRGDTDQVKINAGLSATLQIQADKGCVISSVAVDGTQKSVPQNAVQMDLTLENLNADHTLEVAYTRVAYACYVSHFGNGTVTVLQPTDYDTNGYVNEGGLLHISAVADEGYKILAITVNEIPQALNNYGDGENLTSAQIVVEEVKEATSVLVTFSSPETQYVTLDIVWNEGGVCNEGDSSQQVVKGHSYSISIVPNSGYEVAYIYDGDTVIDNFVGDAYYVRDINENRVVTVEFKQKELPFRYGDINRDGKVNAVDALMVLKFAVGKLEFNEEEKTLARLDLDDAINAKDALLILKYAVGKIQKFPVEE